MTGDPIPFPSAHRPPRVEWSEFFRRHAQPHGLRLFMPHLVSQRDARSDTRFDARSDTGDDVRRTEEALSSLLKRHRAPGPHALRRSLEEKAPRVECVFVEAVAANELAALIGAVPGPPPVGYRTFRRLAADAPACERIWRLAADSSLSWQWGQGPSSTADALEKIARAIVADVHVFTEGRSHRWAPLDLVTRRLVLLDDPEPAVQLAVSRGWLARAGRHSIRLTEAGCHEAVRAAAAGAS